MTPEQFHKLEQICKNHWERVAGAKDRNIDTRMKVFSCDCPACEISLRTANQMGLNTPHKIHFAFYCPYCPIKDWQEKSVDCQGAVCESKGELHRIFLSGIRLFDKGFSGAEDMVVHAALGIANKEWRWMKEYENVYVDNLLEKFKD